MRVFVCFFIHIFLSIPFTELLSQNVANNEYVASEATSFETGENLQNGTNNASFELGKLDLEGGATLPIELVYSGGNGIPVNQYHSNVGLGWSMNTHLSVRATIRGKSDFYSRQGSVSPAGQYFNIINTDDRDCYASGTCDSQADIFNVSLLGQNVSFYYDRQFRKWRTIPEDLGIEIEGEAFFNDATSEDDKFGFDNFFKIAISSNFKITDQLGYVYFFGGLDNITLSNSYNKIHSEDAINNIEIFPVEWHCTKMITPYTKQEVNFEYEDEIYSYRANISTEQKSLTTSLAAPDNNYYESYSGADRFSSYFSMDKRLSKVSYRNQEVEFISTSRNTAVSSSGNSGEARMLNTVRFKSNGQRVNSYLLDYDIVQGVGADIDDTNYTLDKNIFLLRSFKEYGGLDWSGNDPWRHLFHEFQYYNEDDIPRRLSASMDYWGYYNGQENLTLIPEIYNEYGDPIYNHYANRKANNNLSKNGLLESITNPSGGVTIFDYEPNRVKSNNIVFDITDEHIGNLDHTTEELAIYCYGAQGSRLISFSEYLFAIEANSDKTLLVFGLRNATPQQGCHGPALNYLALEIFKIENGIEERVHTFNGHNADIDLINFEEGNYKLVYSTSGATHLKLGNFNQINYIDGGGVRLKSKTESDEDGDVTDDIVTNYTYSLGEWGYDFLPSIEAKFLGNNYSTSPSFPLIPEINDGPNDYPSYQFVISTLSQSPFSGFASLVYYDTIKIDIDGVAGYTELIYDTPSNLKSNGECEFLYKDSNSTESIHNRMKFVNGGITEYHPNGDNLSDQICYDANTSVLSAGNILSKSTYSESPDGAGGSVFSLIESTLYEYEMVTAPKTLYGKICKGFIQDQVFNWSWSLIGSDYITICNDYNINYDSKRLLKETRTIDGLSVVKDYTYLFGSPFTVKEIDQYVVGLETDILKTEFIYPQQRSSEGVDWIDTMLHRNMGIIPIEKRISRNGTLIDGNKIDYSIDSPVLDDFNLVKEVFYKPVNGTFVIESKANDWDYLGRILSLHKALEGCTIADPIDNNYYAPISTQSTLYANSDNVHTTGIGDRITTYSYYNTGKVNTITDYNGNQKGILYDNFGRVAFVKDGSFHETEFKYYNNRMTKESRLLSFSRYPNDNTIDDLLVTSYKDGLGRLTHEINNAYSDSGSDIITKQVTYTSSGNIKEVVSPINGKVITEYENSPLQRRVKDVFTSVDNISYERLIGYGSNSSSITIVDNDGNAQVFPPNTLFVTTITDEFGNVALEYSTIYDLVVRKEKINNGTSLITDFYFNEFGQLLCKTPPAGEKYVYTYENQGHSGSPVNRLSTAQAPGEQAPTEYIYDRYGRPVLIKNASDIDAIIYDKYGQVIHRGSYTGMFPTSSSFVFDADIPIGDIEILESIIYDGDNMECEYPSEITTAFIKNDNSLDATKSSTRTFLNDSYGRALTISFTNHLGQNEEIINSYNTAGMLESSTHTHSINSDHDYQFIWESVYDSKLRNIESIYNSQVVNSFEYDDYDRLKKKNYYKYGSGISDYWHVDEYSYDGFGRLEKINDLSNLNVNTTNNRNIFCEQRIDLNSFIQVFSNVNITYLDSDGIEVNIEQIPDNFNLDLNSDSDKNAVVGFLEAFLVLNKFTFDDVYFKNKSIVISQSNSNFSNFKFGTDQEIEVQNILCCNDFPLDNLFAQEIIYDKSLVKENHWSTLEDRIQTYQYHYDDIGRLLVANHSDRDSYSSALIGDHDTKFNNNTYNQNAYTNSQIYKYSTAYQYDQNSNIVRLSRRGKYVNNDVNTESNSDDSDTHPFGYGLIDRLVYSYNNQTTSNGITSTAHLNVVSDYSERSEGFYGTEFSGITDVEGGGITISSATLSYDNSGNVINHTGEYIDGSIIYNRLNRPSKIIGRDGEMRVEYGGDGQLLRKESYDENGTLLYTSDFIGNLEYRDEKLYATHFADGRILLNANDNNNIKTQFEYDLKDYKGQTRVRFSDLDGNNEISFADILATKDYYPFGMEWETSFINKESNNYKGFQQMHNVREFNLLISNYRILDPQIGKWLQVDPEVDQFPFVNPYTSMGNNPVMYDDRNGNFIQLAVAVAIIAYDAIKTLHNLRVRNKDVYTEWGATINSHGVWSTFASKKIISFALNYVIPIDSNLFPGDKFLGNIVDHYIEDVLTQSVEGVFGLYVDYNTTNEKPTKDYLKTKWKEAKMGFLNSVISALGASLLETHAISSDRSALRNKLGITDKRKFSVARPNRTKGIALVNGLAFSEKKNIKNLFGKSVSGYTKLDAWQYGVGVVGSLWQLHLVGASGWAYKETVTGQGGGFEYHYGSVKNRNKLSGRFDPNFSYPANWDKQINANRFIGLLFSAFRSL